MVGMFLLKSLFCFQEFYFWIQPSKPEPNNLRYNNYMEIQLLFIVCFVFIRKIQLFRNWEYRWFTMITLFMEKLVIPLKILRIMYQG